VGGALIAVVVHAHVPRGVMVAAAVTQGLWWGEGEGRECRVGGVVSLGAAVWGVILRSC